MVADTPSASALKQRAYRARRAHRVRSLRLEVPPEVIRQFVAWGWLSRDEARDDNMLRDAINDLLECWERGTLRAGPVLRRNALGDS